MSILPKQLELYRKFFGFILKYWNSDLVTSISDKAADNTGSDSEDFSKEDAVEFTEDLKRMGPTYIKLGQLLSTRPDLLPETHLKALTELQDDVDPIGYDEISKIVETELGVKISKAFKSFDKEPLASASIGQVHIGELQSGQKVAVKIQRPGIRVKFLDDLDTLRDMANWAVKHSKEAKKFNLRELIEELRYTLLKELDYEAEANNLKVLKRNMSSFKHLYIPEAIEDYSTSKILTMEFVEGRKVTKIHPIKRIDDNLEPIVDDLVQGFLKQVVQDGMAHGDPHPGNIHITQENQLAFMDLGMVVRFPKSLQEQILRLLLGISNYDSEQVTKVLLNMSNYNDQEADIELFKKQISRLILENQNQAAANLQTGRLIIQMNKIAAHNGIIIPVVIHMLAKILLNLDQIIAILAPKYDLNKTIREYSQELIQAKMTDELKPANVLNLALETKRLAEKMPDRLNTIMETLAQNNLRINVDGIDENRFTAAFQKVANRITLGIIVAAMIVGAALLIQVPTEFHIFGYPALAIVFFLLAAIIGFYIIYQIIFKDENFKKEE